ncbi:MAG: hypothetical protein JNJ57_01060, partial [Saprospiraceae bacterium]|nr:hypothetical protein [Saprospiraceae bacterium]
MKAVPLLLGLCFALSTTTLFAQTTGFNYQAVLRNSSYQPLTNQTGIATVAIENAAGTVLYQESHGISTDPLGLFNLVIGKGLNPVGNFNNIDWSNGGRFVRITVSANNNTYSFPPSELQAVPYAKVAERVLQSTPYTAGPGISISNNVITNTGDVNPTDDLNVTSIAGGDIQGPFSNLQIKANSIGTGEIQNGSILAEDLAPGVLSSGAWTLNNN